MKPIIKFFSSIKLAIILIIIITIASILGTLIPQGRSAAEYAARYGPISNLMTRLEITRLYHSWWYIAILFLFSLNIVVCTLSRLSPKLRKVFHPRIDSPPKNILALKTSDRLKKNWPSRKTADQLKSTLSKQHYRVREKSQENKVFIHGRKRTLGHFGSDIVHLGLLVILIGGIISGLGGFRDNLTISEGQTVDVPQADFKLRLDKFETDYYPNGAVKDWKSHLTVIENDKDVLTKMIEVNHPLSHDGFVFYQSSYGWDWKNPFLEVWAKKKQDPSYLEKIKVRIGEKITLPDEGLEITVLQFVPDFIIGENNRVQTRSLDPNNPAAYIEGKKDGETVFSGWIFANYPDFSRMHSDVETDLNFELKDFTAKQYSGIQMAKDPGVNFIWLGCILLTLGLFVAFYWPPREIRAVCEESQNKTEIIAGGTAGKNKEAFQSEFEKIVGSLRRSK